MLRNTAGRRLLCSNQAFPELSGVFSGASTSKQTIHTSASVHETARKRVARLKKRDQRDKRFENERLARQNKPHPALGYLPGNETIWTQSKLYNIILKRGMLDAMEIPKVQLEMEKETIPVFGEDGKPVFDVEKADYKVIETGNMVPKLVNGRSVPVWRGIPELLNFGLDTEERNLLFKNLGMVREAGKGFERDGQEARRPKGAKTNEELWSSGAGAAQAEIKTKEEQVGKKEDYEKGLQYWTGRVLDLKNSNAAGLAFENKRRIIDKFSSGDVNDTGRIEVQAALLTHRIHNLWEHLGKFKRDIHNRRRILELIHARAKLLKYLRRTERARYEAVLPQLGLERGAIEEEIIMPREMFRANAVSL